MSAFAQKEFGYLADQRLRRGVEVRGSAEVLGEGGDELRPGFASELSRIHPECIVGWGIEPDGDSPNSRSVGREAA
ncbi:MAG TPA: hypothetical protein VK276_07540 [Rubrobacteraceae bacterium]|nr:hypothetical protein [Rubrobacteraceae bacterium]